MGNDQKLKRDFKKDFLLSPSPTAVRFNANQTVGDFKWTLKRILQD